MNHLRTTLLVVALLVAVGSVSATPLPTSDHVVYIGPFSDQTHYNVAPSDQVRIRFGYYACSRGLTLDYTYFSQQTWKLTREGRVLQEIGPEKASHYWEEPKEYTQGDTTGCLWPSTVAWISVWESPNLNVNASGDYTLSADLDTAEPLIDGYDYDGDGRPDYSLPGEPFQGTYTIHVGE